MDTVVNPENISILMVMFNKKGSTGESQILSKGESKEKTLFGVGTSDKEGVGEEAGHRGHVDALALLHLQRV